MEGVVTQRHQLEASLKSLGLSGMLETLEARLAQAHAGEFGHLEFLQSLCETSSLVARPRRSIVDCVVPTSKRARP
jgi:hypothetical protein